MSFIIESIVSVGMIFSFSLAPTTTFAACEGNVVEFLGLESWDACLPRGADGKPVFEALTDIWKIIIPLLNDVLKLAGYIAIGLIIWGGIQYIKSQGEPSNLTQAKDTIKNAIIGLLLVLSSIAIVQFIYRGFVQ
jgi:hypothetical protein